MRKTVIILSILALIIAVSCRQAEKKQAETQNTTAMEQAQDNYLTQNNYLNEEWYCETNVSENLITVSHSFDKSGKYEYRRSETLDMYTKEAFGTYHYQPGTDEIFIHIDKSLENSITGFYAPMRDYKQYLKILELNDITSIVASSLVEIDWEISRNGKYKLIEPQNVETMELTYQRLKKGK